MDDKRVDIEKLRKAIPGIAETLGGIMADTALHGYVQSRMTLEDAQPTVGMTFRPKEGADLKISLSIAFAEPGDEPGDESDADGEPDDKPGDESGSEDKPLNDNRDTLYAKVWDRIRAAGAMYMTPETIVRTSIETVLDEIERVLKEKEAAPNAM